VQDKTRLMAVLAAERQAGAFYERLLIPAALEGAL
jgi:hypothetical protein